MQRHEVVVVGAGLAGLTCAVELCRRDFDVVVLEASDAVGGRIRTDLVDGFRLDRGFQLLNPAYPALRGLVDVDDLALRRFEPGVVVAYAGEQLVVADPFRSPRDLMGDLVPASGSALEKACFAAYAARCAYAPPARLRALDDVGYGEALDRVHVAGRLRRRVLEPFLAGVLAEDDQSTSRHFVDLVLRMFARAVPGVPSLGMQALPEQVAGLLPVDALRVGVRVDSLDGRTARCAVDDWTGEAVVVAVDGGAAAGLLPVPTPVLRGLTTYYHRVAESPAGRRMLHVDGDRAGPVVNTAVVSDAAPSYASSGALVQSTILGAHDDAETLTAIEAQLGRIYGVDTSRWELVTSYPIPAALPAMLPPLDFRQPVDLGDGRFVCGDHRDTASIQGAIVSGRRAATAVTARLRP